MYTFQHALIDVYTCIYVYAYLSQYAVLIKIQNKQKKKNKKKMAIYDFKRHIKNRYKNDLVLCISLLTNAHSSKVRLNCFQHTPYHK